MSIPAERMSLADVKSHLSEVVEDVETEHRRVVITKHGQPAAILIAAEDLEALEDTLDILSDSDAVASIGRSLDDESTGRVERLTKEQAVARWKK
jgi:antitoxin YefM